VGATLLKPYTQWQQPGNWAPPLPANLEVLALMVRHRSRQTAAQRL